MHPDFKRIATLRKFMMRGDAKAAPNYGRDIAAKWIAQHGNAVPDGVTVKPLPHNAGRVIAPDGARGDETLIYIHGGGLVYYDTTVFTPFLAQLSVTIGTKITALDYPKAPETHAITVFETLVAQTHQILADSPKHRFTLAGDSVGGLLALQLCQTLKSPQVTNLHLIYPVVDRTIDPACPFGTDHFLDTGMMSWFYKLIAPLFEQNGCPCDMAQSALSHLPPTTLHVAEADILAAQGHRFADRLRDAGRLRQLQIHKGLPHDFCLYGKSSAAAGTGIATIARGMKGLVDA